MVETDVYNCVTRKSVFTVLM